MAEPVNDHASPSPPPPPRLVPGNGPPQAIAHRGYSAALPENTMAAFRAAVAAGAHAIETDLHLSRDGVPVLSHDASLRRCYGVDRPVRDCAWPFLATLTTVRQPAQPMPRLADLLAWLAGDDDDHEAPTSAPVWVLLDIKLDDDAQELVDAIRDTVAQVPAPARARWTWEQRIVLGCWNASTIKACQRSLPAFRLAHIGVSLSYATHFRETLDGGQSPSQQGGGSRLALNMALPLLVRPVFGARFMRRHRGGPLYTWTVNNPRWMRWCIRRGDLIDGVVTDDPRLYLELCHQEQQQQQQQQGVADYRGGGGGGGVKGRGRGGTGVVDSWGEWAAAAAGVAAKNVLMVLIFWFFSYVRPKLDRMDGAGRAKKQC